MRILLVDDDVYTLDILTTFLGKTMQSDVLSVATKKKAVEALEREDFLFIITDIKLEDGSGYEVLEKAKRKNVLTPVIGITGYVDELEDTYMSINFDALIRKPLHLQGFLKKLNEVNSKFFQIFFYGSFGEFREASPETSDKKMVVFTTEEYAAEVREYLKEKQLDSFGAVVPGFIYRSKVFENGIMTMFISHRATEIKLCDSGSLIVSDPENTKSHLVFYDVCTLDLEDFNDEYGKVFEDEYVLGIGCGDKYL
ncbi:MAG: response regulator, partial [Flexistipes sinusarabici]